MTTGCPSCPHPGESLSPAGQAPDGQRRAAGAARRPHRHGFTASSRRPRRAGGGGAQRRGGEESAARRRAAGAGRRLGDRHLRGRRLNTMDELVLAGQRFTSRLVVGTGKYKDFSTMKAALGASGAKVAAAAGALSRRARGVPPPPPPSTARRSPYQAILPRSPSPA